MALYICHAGALHEPEPVPPAGADVQLSRAARAEQLDELRAAKRIAAESVAAPLRSKTFTRFVNRSQRLDTFLLAAAAYFDVLIPSRADAAVSNARRSAAVRCIKERIASDGARASEADPPEVREKMQTMARGYARILLERGGDYRRSPGELVFFEALYIFTKHVLLPRVPQGKWDVVESELGRLFQSQAPTAAANCRELNLRGRPQLPQAAANLGQTVQCQQHATPERSQKHAAPERSRGARAGSGEEVERSTVEASSLMARMVISGPSADPDRKRHSDNRDYSRPIKMGTPAFNASATRVILRPRPQSARPKAAIIKWPQSAGASRPQSAELLCAQFGSQSAFRRTARPLSRRSSMRARSQTVPGSAEAGQHSLHYWTAQRPQVDWSVGWAAATECIETDVPLGQQHHPPSAAQVNLTVNQVRRQYNSTQCEPIERHCVLREIAIGPSIGMIGTCG